MVFGPFWSQNGHGFYRSLRSENGCGKWRVLVGSGFGEPGGTPPPRIPRSTPPPPSNYSDLRKMSCKPLPSLCFKARLSGRPFMFFFHSNANKTHFYQRGFVLTLVLKVRVLELGNPKSPGVEFFETAPNISLESERKFRRPVYISSIQRLIISKLHSRLFQLLNSFLLALLLKYIFFYWKLFNLY